MRLATTLAATIQWKSHALELNVIRHACWHWRVLEQHLGAEAGQTIAAVLRACNVLSETDSSWQEVAQSDPVGTGEISPGPASTCDSKPAQAPEAGKHKVGHVA